MNVEILKTVSQVAGIGGIVVGTLLIIFLKVIKKNIFPSLKKNHAFALLRLIVILTWSIAILGLFGWILLEYTKANIDKGKVSLSQFMIGKNDKGKFIEVVVNNTTSSNVVLSKFVYSRGVSSSELEAIPECCLSCMQAWYAVQKGEVNISTPGTRVHQAVSFVRIGAEGQFFKGRLHWASGCFRRLFAQLEMNISVVAPAKTVTKVGVLWPDVCEETTEFKEKLEPYEAEKLLSPNDTVCVYIGVEADAFALTICRPDSEFVEYFL